MQVLLDVPPSLPDTAADRERNQYAEGKRAAFVNGGPGRGI